MTILRGDEEGCAAELISRVDIDHFLCGMNIAMQPIEGKVQEV